MNGTKITFRHYVKVATVPKPQNKEC